MMLECKRKQLTTAHAKIHELEAEKTKLSKTNHILSERIKMFDRANGKEMFEQYFPPKASTHASDAPAAQPTATSCSPHHCCIPPPCHCYNRCNLKQDSPEILTKIRELSEIVTRTVTETAALRAELAELIKPVTPTTKPPQASNLSHADIILSPDIVVVERGESQATPERHPSNQQDMSTSSVLSSPNTIDDNVHDELNNSHHLNCNLLTNQF